MDNLLTSFRLFRRDAKQQRHDPARLAQAATHVQRIARGYITRKDFMTCPVCLTITNEPVAISRCGHSVCRRCRGLCFQPPNQGRCPICRRACDSYRRTEQTQILEAHMLSPRDTSHGTLPQRPWSSPERRRTWLGHRFARSASEPAISSVPTQLYSTGSERSGSRSLHSSFRKVRLIFSELFGSSKGLQSHRDEWSPPTPRILSLGDLADEVWDPNAEGGQSGALDNASLIYPPDADGDEGVVPYTPVVLGRRGSRQRDLYSL